MNRLIIALIIHDIALRRWTTDANLNSKYSDSNYKNPVEFSFGHLFVPSYEICNDIAIITYGWCEKDFIF